MAGLARVAYLGGAVIAVVVIGVIVLGGSGGSPVPGMPASVANQLGASPVTVTLDGSTLAMISSPGVGQLATLESAIARQRGVARAYGPVTWLRARFAALGRQVSSHVTAKISRSDLLVRDGATGGLTLGDGALTSTLVFGTGEAPVRSVRWLFPTASQARIFLRLTGSVPGATIARRVQGLIAASGLVGVTATIRGG